MSRSLESRLRALAVEAPDDLVARAKARAAAPARRRRRLTPAMVAVGLAAVLLLAGTANVAAAYLVPAYGRAIADTPLGILTEPLLHAGGQTAEQVTTVGQSVTSSGHTIRLVGAYADGLQTTIYLQVDGQPLATPATPGAKVLGDRYLASVELTDESGRHYQERGGSGTSMIEFEPLSGPAASTGVRLTLHVSRLSDLGSSAPGRRGAPTSVAGDWTFHFTLRQRPASSLPLPAPLHVGDTTYTFTSIRGADTLEVTITVSGGAAQRWNQVQPGAGPPPSDVIEPYRVDLYNQAGQPQRVGYGHMGGAVIDASWVLDGTGRYRLHVGGSQGADYWFDVPRP